MRRKDREVTDFSDILSIIGECDIIRIGLADGELPYIVPVNFGYGVDGNTIRFYIHGATAGRKYALLKKNGKCSFEMDVPLKLECLPESRSVTMRYRSVMGSAAVSFAEGDEKRRIIDRYIMGRYSETKDFAYNTETLQNTAVAVLTVTEITAKANPVTEE